jgi:lysophospholipase L1-like esterase
LTEWFDWQKRFPQHHVINAGLSGETAEGLLERIPNLAFKENPDFIFLMTGANNIVMEDYDIDGVMEKIVSRLSQRFKSALIVVQSILPMALDWVKNPDIEDLNNRIKLTAEKAGAQYLDVYSRFFSENKTIHRDYLLDDGVHLSDKGYDVWAKAVENALNVKKLIEADH